MVKLFNVRQQSIVFSQLNAPSSIQKTADADMQRLIKKNSNFKCFDSSDAMRVWEITLFVD